MKTKQKRKGLNISSRNSRGITVIALTITIIVLLILAGVSLGTISGDDGILNKATEVKKENEEAEEDELRRLTALEAATQLKEYEYTDVSGEKVIIPAKCAVSRIEGENTLKDGLVIIDENRNEWVWIEVPKNEMPEKLTFEDDADYTTLKTALKNYTSDYARADYIDEWFDENGNTASETLNLQDRLGCGLTSEEYITLYNKMLKSIYQNSGFWIGRYEAGTTEHRTSSQGITEKAKIQKEMYPYTYISCTEAQSLASQISPDTLKTSSLLFGIQWDLVCKFLETKGNVALNDIKSNSKEWGNYAESTFTVSSGKYAIRDKSTNQLSDWKEVTGTYVKQDEGTENLVLFSTGVTNRNKKMNIYDLAGNEEEYTLERSMTPGIPCVTRGGNFRNTSSMAIRGIYNSNNNLSSSISFRIAMY